MSARGEGTIILPGGREVRVLYTNRAILNAEQQLGKGILGVLAGFQTNTSGFTELVALLRSGMEAARQDDHAGGLPISNKDALNVLDQVGFTACAGPVMESLAAVIGYSAEEEQEEGEADPN